MRRLPVFFLIDISESMVGDPITKVQEGIDSILKELRTDPTVLETVYVSVIAFAGRAKTLTPLTEILEFTPPDLPIGGGTSLGNALNHTMYEIDAQVIKTTHDRKGDWKPLIFLFTDGSPTDDPRDAVNRWLKDYKNRVHVIAISMGESNDTFALRKMTENVLVFPDMDDADTWRKFFKWITASIKTQSASVSTNPNDLNLPDAENWALDKAIDDLMQPDRVDDNFAVIKGRCSSTRNDYLMKYRKVPDEYKTKFGLTFNQDGYVFEGSYRVDKRYEEFSDISGTGNQIKSHELIGAGSCPHCGNKHAFVICQCNAIFCIGGPGMATCPTCNRQGDFQWGEGSVDVQRAKG